MEKYQVPSTKIIRNPNGLGTGACVILCGSMSARASDPDDLAHKTRYFMEETHRLSWIIARLSDLCPDQRTVNDIINSTQPRLEVIEITRRAATDEEKAKL